LPYKVLWFACWQIYILCYFFHSLKIKFMLKVPQEIFLYLSGMAEYLENPDFLENDPISVPHRFSRKEDIEVSAFLTATISWGNRKSIIRSADKLIRMMDFSPFEFLMHAGDRELAAFRSFSHRTFNGDDCQYFLSALRRIYNRGGLEGQFSAGKGSLKDSMAGFRRVFFSAPHFSRTKKHLADPERGSAAKRLNMFLRWMVRSNARGVDFGIWRSISPSSLYCPLDVHSGNTARNLGLLTRKQNDWKAVEELTEVLRSMDPDDPVRFDFALFGSGVSRAIRAPYRGPGS
jgi:uncharacterized protein (TIGR02757 family)